jgi:hypothetical protein
VAGGAAPDRRAIERFLAPVHRLVASRDGSSRPSFQAARLRDAAPRPLGLVG